MRFWSRLFRQPSRPSRTKQKPAWRRPTFRPNLDVLEDRCLLAAPVIDPLQVPLNIPAGKTLIVPITATDPQGGSVSYTVTSSNPNVQVLPHTGNTFLKIDVAGFGTMEFELFNDLTPMTAALIGGMAKSEFYDGLTFHRIVPNFVIQGGDPAGNGTGGPGFTFNDEFNPQLIYSGTGQLAMANSGKDTNGSQFFVSVGPQRGLDFNNAIFGQLVRGFDVLNAIDNVPTDANNKPLIPVVITDARIVQDTTDAVFTLQSTGSTADTTTLTITATSSTGGSTTEQVTANVVADTTNDPPILGPVSDQVSPTGAPVTFTLTRTDIDGGASTFEANFVNAADANNATITVTPSADNTSATVTVTPKAVNGAPFTGSIPLLVGVEEQGATARGTTTTNLFDTQQINVAFGDQPLSITSGGTVSGTEGSSAANLTLATFTDADTSAAAGNFHVSINWGDGTPLDTTTGNVTGGSGSFTVTGTHTYKEAGTFPVHVVVTDTGGATASTDATASVADAPLSGGQGVAVTGLSTRSLAGVPVATFSDADPNAQAGDFAATITWGDGSTSAGTVQALGGGRFQVVGTHSFAAVGTFPVSVAITDVNPAGDAAPAALTVTTSAAVTSINGAFVTQAFHDLLGRLPTANELSLYSGQLDKGDTRLHVTHEIQALPGYQAYQVVLMYRELLGTTPTAAQMKDATTQLSQGTTLGQLRINLMAGPTYFQVRGGGTNAGFLTAAVQDILGGQIDSATEAQLLGDLDRGAARADILKMLFGQNQAKQTGIRDLYLAYIGRQPTATELAQELPKWTSGKAVDELIAMLVASPDYLNKLRTNGPVGG